MGREIRRVPPNWQHPKRKRWDAHGEYESYIPLRNQTYIEAITGWVANHNLWERGEHPDQEFHDTSKHAHYASWAGNAPQIEDYRPEWAPGEATWYQVYETVTEGTPVTPSFATKEEIVEYLVVNGDFSDQRCGEGPWDRQAAERFVEDEWAPTFIMHVAKQ